MRSDFVYLILTRAISSKTLKDLNYIEMMKNGKIDFTLGSEIHKTLLESLKKDSEFLASIDVIDYSVLLGVHNCMCFF